MRALKRRVTTRRDGKHSDYGIADRQTLQVIAVSYRLRCPKK